MVYSVGDYCRIERGEERATTGKVNNPAGRRRDSGRGVAGAGGNCQEGGEETPVCDHRVTRGTVTAAVDATGELKHGRQEYIYWEVAGTVTQLLVSPGDTVREGQLLARLESQAARDRLTDAKDSLEIARIKLAKAEEAFQTARQDAELQYERAKADLAAAALRLEELKEGAGAPELETARSNLRAAERACQAAEKEFALNEQLFAEGLIARRYDASLAALEAAGPGDHATSAWKTTKPLMRRNWRRRARSANLFAERRWKPSSHQV